MKELLVAAAVLRMAANERFANNAAAFYDRSVKMIGVKATNKLVKATFYSHFAAGESESELKAIYDRMRTYNVRLMLCPPMEDIHSTISLKTYDQIKTNIDRYIDYARVALDIDSNDAVIQFKPTSIFPAELMTYLSKQSTDRGQQLSTTAAKFVELMKASVEPKEVSTDVVAITRNALYHFNRLLNFCASHNVCMYMDAELYNMHYMEHALGLAACQRNNKPEANARTLIFTTFQNCFKDMSNKIDLAMEAARQLDCKLGLKCVRGAYVNTERRLAKHLHYPDPTCPSHEATSEQYDTNIARIIGLTAEDANHYALTVASNNVASIVNARQKLTLHNIPNDNNLVYFAQVYGFVEHLSYDLGACGYRCYKSIPYGPVAEWVPYLCRRAAESHSAFKTARTELPLIADAIQRKLLKH